MNDWRKQFLFYSIIAMMATLFLSRALLSVSMMLFVLASFLHKDIKGHIRHYFLSPLLWSMSLLFILPLISGLWSEDKKEWLNVLQLKLPLLFLPLAFAGPLSFSKKQWDLLAYFFIALMVAGTIWSMFHYSRDMQAINESYLRAKSIMTPLGNDHIRFSWLISVTVLLAGWMWWQRRDQREIVSWVLLIVIAWLVIFLHVLAARTGLLSFYIIVFGAVLWLIFKKAKPLYGTALFILLIALPLIAYWLLPSFRNRISYIRYDYSHVKELHYLPGANDVARATSIRAGWNILKENPLGIGAGDIFNETKKWDREQYPDILETDMLYPSSEWLIYGLICGWPGVLLFTGIMLMPFFIKRNGNMIWVLLNLIAAFSFLFDMGLEVQFGVFIYSFLVLWWWKWLKEITLTHD